MSEFKTFVLIISPLGKLVNQWRIIYEHPTKMLDNNVNITPSLHGVLHYLSCGLFIVNPVL